MGLYRATSEAAEAVYEPGEFERDWTVEQENDALASGLVEIVPQTYRVVGDTRVFETAPGETFEAALRIEQEKALIDGGHIALVDDAKKPKAAAAAEDGDAETSAPKSTRKAKGA